MFHYVFYSLFTAIISSQQKKIPVDINKIKSKNGLNKKKIILFLKSYTAFYPLVKI